MTRRYSPKDIPNYPDMGCPEATEYLGYQSYCKTCPFPRCLDDEPNGRRQFLIAQRNEEIKRLFKQGKTTKELTELFKVGKRTIERMIYG